MITLKASHLRLVNLGGLVSETIALAASKMDALGTIATVKFRLLDTCNTEFLTRLSLNRSSNLTPRIKAKDRECEQLFADIMRTSKAAKQSSLAATAAAGKVLVDFLHPFRGLSRKHMVTQMVQTNSLADDYAAAPDVVSAAATLGLAPVFQSLFAANTVMLDFYNERLSEMSAAKGPSASSLKNRLVVAYNDFCAAVILTLSTLPSRELQVLRNEMNAIRRKYIQRKFKDSKVSEFKDSKISEFKDSKISEFKDLKI